MIPPLPPEHPLILDTIVAAAGLVFGAFMVKAYRAALALFWE